jgi:hypothetical protein
MGGGAFIWLKEARIGPKSAKQAETGLAIFVKILAIARPWASKPALGRHGTRESCICGDSNGYG